MESEESEERLTKKEGKKRPKSKSDGNDKEKKSAKKADEALASAADVARRLPRADLEGLMTRCFQYNPSLLEEARSLLPENCRTREPEEIVVQAGVKPFFASAEERAGLGVLAGVPTVNCFVPCCVFISSKPGHNGALLSRGQS
jgi:hypothetical protein